MDVYGSDGKRKKRPEPPGGIEVVVKEDNQLKFKDSFSSDVGSSDIVNASTATTATPLKEEEINQLIESIDFAKSAKPYVSSVKLGLNLKKGFYFEIERKPSIITKTKAEKKSK